MVERASAGVRVSGPLWSLADGFGEVLAEHGYSLASAREHVRLLAHVSRWMDAEGLDVVQLTPAAIERFLVERRRQGYVSRISSRGLAPLLGYLDGLGVLPPAPGAPSTPVNGLVAEFVRYLREERGLTAGSAQLYAGVARRFLAERAEPIGDDLAGLRGADITAFVLRESRRRGQRSAETVVCGLRSLLRFLHVQGWIAMPLASAVPSVPRRREDLPRGLAVEQVRLLLSSCDRTSALGCRDFAIVTLLARLGLRCGEVAALRLDDVSWRTGELVICGKGPRIDRLPLPVDVGQALADYLCRGRPRGFGRTLFLRSCAPLCGLSGSAVSMVVASACRRAGIPEVRAHRLRHTLASELLRHGAGLPEIGQVLRHERVQTTAMYAKVDRVALSRLTVPWPGSGS
jgi:integrase/recombinase XerD